MSFGDISFIAAFVIFPLLIVVASVWALRTLARRERRPLARFSANRQVESTQELPIADRAERRDWAATVQPTRGPSSDGKIGRSKAGADSFKVPAYRGRSTGVVRRIPFQGRNPRRPAETPPIRESEPR